MEQLVEQAYETFAEQARAPRRSTTGATRRREPVIVSDGDRVLQIVANLLSNAFRATPDGGRIALELAADERRRCRVVVEDTGPGISPEERERMFRPFVSRDGGGTGLGLAIARELSTRARRPDRARLRAGAGLALRARPAGVAGWGLAGLLVGALER